MTIEEWAAQFEATYGDRWKENDNSSQLTWKNKTSNGFEKRYPEVYLSDELNSILTSKPDLPDEIKKPESPKAPKPPDKEGCVGSIIPVLIMAIVAVVLWIKISEGDSRFQGFDGILPVIGLTIMGFGGVIIYIIHKANYPQEEADYNRDFAEYKSKMISYQNEIEKYNTDVENREKIISRLTSTDNLILHRRNRMSKYFNEAGVVKIDKNIGNAILHGPAELFFYNYIISHIKDAVDDIEGCKWLDAFETLYDTRVSTHSANESFFYPDIVVKCGCFLIDIEIDEPYELQDGSPIHYIDENNFGICVDTNRNSFFTRNEWSVIRFAEEQVIKQPYECLKIIVDFIESTLKGEQFNINATALVRTKKWTKEESHRMAYKKYRNTYLKSV